MKTDLQKLLAASASNSQCDSIGDSIAMKESGNIIDNWRVIDPQILNWQECNKDKLNNTLLISKKDIFIWEIDNAITLLEKELDRIQYLNDPNQNWFCKIILGHINFLLQKYEIIKESTENEVEEEWSDYDLQKELKFILQQCIIKNK